MGTFGVFDAGCRLLWSEFGGFVPVVWTGCTEYQEKSRLNVIRLNVVRVFWHDFSCFGGIFKHSNWANRSICIVCMYIYAANPSQLVNLHPSCTYISTQAVHTISSFLRIG